MTDIDRDHPTEYTNRSAGGIGDAARRFLETAAANERRLAALRGILADFEAVHIPAIPLKGVDFLLRYYPSLGLRPMYDIDLLTRPRDLPAATAILRAKGFRGIARHGSFRQSQIDREVEFISADRTISIDMVWGFWYLDSVESLWHRLVRRETSIGPCDFLHPEDALLYLIAYAVCHRGQFTPAYLDDMAVFMKKEAASFNWFRWVERVRDAGLVSAVHHGLTYAQSRGVEGVPPSIVKLLQPRSLSEKGLEWFFSRTVTTSPPPSIQYLFSFVTAPGWRGKMRLLRLAFRVDPLSLSVQTGQPLTRPARWRRILFRPFWLLLRASYLLPRDLWRLLAQPQ